MISLAHPTLNDLDPPTFVRIAQRTGYDALNLRIIGLDPAAGLMPGFADEARIAAVEAALGDAGVPLLDVEVIRIDADTQAAAYRPLFEIGARLGARYAVAIAMDSDEGRVAEHLGELCAEARGYGLQVVLEFMMRGGIRTLDATRRVVAACDDTAGILIDALHFYRSGAVPADLAPVDPELLPYLQINDVVDFAGLRAAMPPESVVWKKVLPGEGDLPLDALLGALPAGIPISVEVPGTPGWSLEETEAYARRALAATQGVSGVALEGREA